VGRSNRNALLAVLVGVSGCVDIPSVFRCASDDACARDSERGVCEPAGFCSFPDPGCAGSHARYAASASPELRGQCVPRIAFVQGAGANSGYPAMSPTVTVMFPTPTTAGNLLVVSAAWDGTVSISSVMDARADGFAPASDAVAWGGVYWEQVFLAHGISAGTTSVTVSASDLPGFLEVRVYEYAGADVASPLDGMVIKTGNGAALDSGPLTVHGGSELLFALGQADNMAMLTPGSGFTPRPVSGGGGALAEERAIADAGSYSATISLDVPANWVIQLFAFQ
jgi:hypothetical protein